MAAGAAPRISHCSLTLRHEDASAPENIPVFLPEGSARDGSRWDGLKGMVPLGSGIAPGSAALGSPLPPLAPIATPAGQEGSPAVTGEGRAAAGNRRAPSLTPQPLQPPKSISSSPLSILMNRKGSWDPLRQQPWRLNPPKEQIPKQLALQGSAELVEVPHSSVAVKLFTGIVFLREPCPGYTWWLRLPAPLVHALKKKQNTLTLPLLGLNRSEFIHFPPVESKKDLRQNSCSRILYNSWRTFLEREGLYLLWQLTLLLYTYAWKICTHLRFPGLPCLQSTSPGGSWRPPDLCLEMARGIGS